MSRSRPRTASPLAPGLLASSLLAGCGSSIPPDPLLAEKQAWLTAHAEGARVDYSLALAGVQALRPAVEAFVADPTEATLEAARQAWLDGRPAYGETEVHRFYGGPIDGETGPEGRVNGWPLDEAYIDYVQDLAGNVLEGGILSMTVEHPTLDEASLAALNELGGEKNISTGYHAIEFLLWGQDRSTTGPGARPPGDYVVGPGATATFSDRRGQYLLATVSLLESDLAGVVGAWEDAPGTYRASFVAKAPDAALADVLGAMAKLGVEEASSERMGNAYATQDQEEEHSCFSDNTLADLVANVRGIENAYLGRHGGVDGAGLDELVRAVDPALDAAVVADLAAALAAVEAIPAPFDQAILDDAVGRPAIDAAISAVQLVGEDMVEAAAALGLQVVVQ